MIAVRVIQRITVFQLFDETHGMRRLFQVACRNHVTGKYYQIRLFRFDCRKKLGIVRTIPTVVQVGQHNDFGILFYSGGGKPIPPCHKMVGIVKHNP